MPLYVAAFLQGFVLWYAVEKLFMREIGFNDAGIGVMVAAYSLLMLIVETPSGVLADRWSRKGVLVLSSIALTLSSLVGGLSYEPALYIVSALFWGLSYALYTGTYDSIVYDTLAEETGASDSYEKYYGYVRLADSAALVAGSLLGGVVGQIFGLRMTYLVTVPIALLALIALQFFREPQLHKVGAVRSVKGQVVKTFKALMGQKKMFSLLTTIVVMALLTDMLYEFSQLWFIAVDVQPVLYGPAFALILATPGIGGLIAGKVVNHQNATVLGFAAMVVSSVLLITSHEFVLLLAALVVLGVSVSVLSILLIKRMHDALSSDIRAGASSAVSTLGRGLLIVFALAFGAISTAVNVFTAAWLVMGLVVVVIGVNIYHYRSD